MLLEINNVCKTYRGGIRANIDISLSIAKGEVFGLLGPNGAGKTTLVNQIIGLAIPNSGSITLDGVDVVANPGFARESCSFQAQTQVPISGLNTLQAIHKVLPIQYMADLTRGTITDLDVNLGLAFITVGAWCVAGFFVTLVVVNRRR